MVPSVKITPGSYCVKTWPLLAIAQCHEQSIEQATFFKQMPSLKLYAHASFLKIKWSASQTRYWQSANIRSILSYSETALTALKSYNYKDYKTELTAICLERLSPIHRKWNPDLRMVSSDSGCVEGTWSWHSSLCICWAGTSHPSTTLDTPHAPSQTFHTETEVKVTLGTVRGWDRHDKRSS